MVHMKLNLLSIKFNEIHELILRTQMLKQIHLFSAQ